MQLEIKRPMQLELKTPEFSTPDFLRNVNFPTLPKVRAPRPSTETKMTHHHDHGANPLREILIGAAAGAGAAFIMDQFQSLWSRYGQQVGLPGGSRQEYEESAPEKVANQVAELTTGEQLPAEQRKSGEKAVHYAAGAGLGAVYGVIASSIRGVSLGHGLAFGGAAYLLLDQGLAPMIKLGQPVSRDSNDQKFYSLISHLVFGYSTYSLRKLLGGR